MEFTPQGFFRRRNVRIVLLGLLSLGIVFGAWRYWHTPRYKGVARIQVDLRNPEMLLATRNLAQLPRDVAAASALSGLVDEQLVFHYEEDEARLSLDGTLRRLAYEHDLDLQDRFLSTLLAAPAEIAFWRSGKGRPEHFVATLERGILGRLTETFARIALDDRQLKQAGTFSLGGDKVTLYTLDYGGGRTLAFAGLGDRWVFLSDPRIALDAEGGLSADGASILGDMLHGHNPWQAKLPHAASAQHSFVIGRQALTLDYGRFLPALAGLRFDHDGSAWRASIRLDESKLPANPDLASIWRTIPLGAALCTALPVHWAAVAAPLETLIGADPAIRATLSALDPVTAVCWYPDSRLSAPLFVARASTTMPPETSSLLARLAEKSWSATAVPDEGRNGKGQLHVATVASRHGIRRSNGEERNFQLALAQQDGLLLFSPDRRKVEAALAVAAKRAPALGDETGLRGPAWLTFDPKLLAQMVRSEVQEVLPMDEESFFRDIARNRLWPRLENWGKGHPATVAVPASADRDGFVRLDFRPLKGEAR